MKTNNKYNRVVQYVTDIVRAINRDCFDNLLPLPTVTIQSSSGCFGYLYCDSIWKSSTGNSYELNLGAEYLSRPIENVVATLMHEMTHLYCLINDIKDTSNNGVYHNKRFKHYAEELCKLDIKKLDDVHGWTITEVTESVLDFCVLYNLHDIDLRRDNFSEFVDGGVVGTSNSGSKNGKTRKPSSTRKYQCPCCGNSFRATKDLRVLCIDCDEEFQLVK